MKHNLFIQRLCLLMIGFLGITQLLAQATIEWQKSLGGSGDDIAYSIQQTLDGGYIVAGSTGSNDGDVTGNHGLRDYWVVKLDGAGNIQWQKALGGSENDQAYGIQQTLDRGYIIIGASNSNDGDITGNHGKDDSWVVKLDSIGNIQWQKSLGGSDIDWGYSIQQTINGGYIVGGLSHSNDGDVTGNHAGKDSWVVKLDSIGNIQWQKSLGGSGDDGGLSIHQTLDGGYIFAGYTDSNDGDVTVNHGSRDYWILKTDSIGNLEWQKSLGGSFNESASSIRQCTDSGYIITGSSSSNDGDVTVNYGGYNFWVVKLNIIGTIEWQKSLGGWWDDYASSIQQDLDDGYIITGRSDSNTGDVTGNHGNGDYWVVKLSSIGAIQWQKALGGIGCEWASSIQQTTNGGYIVAGQSNFDDGDVTGNHGNNDFWIVKLSSTTATETPTLPNITISPNPTSGKLYINLKNLPTADALQVSITNLLGQTILQQEMITPTCTIDIPTQPAGVYFLHIKQSNGVEIVRKVEKL